MVANCTHSRVVCGIIAQWFGFKLPAQNAEHKYISTTDPSTSIENRKNIKIVQATSTSFKNREDVNIFLREPARDKTSNYHPPP
jgi:hypothetical protein